jgi:hypothetical protein
MYLGQSNLKEKYVCATYCELTHENLKKPDGSCYIETWYVHAFDPERKAHRQDEFMQTKINGAGQTDNGRHRFASVYFESGEVSQWNGRSKTTLPVDLEKDDAQFADYFPTTYCEPFSPTVIGAGALERHRGPRLSSHIAKLFAVYKLVDEEDYDYGVAQTFSTRNPELFDKIYFDERYGNMPVLLKRTLGKNGKHFERIATTWTEIDDRWYPKEIEIEQDNTQFKSSIKLWYYWMLTDLPVNVFPDSTGEIMDTRRLKELVVEKSVGVSRK